VHAAGHPGIAHEAQGADRRPARGDHRPRPHRRPSARPAAQILCQTMSSNLKGLDLRLTVWL